MQADSSLRWAHIVLLVLSCSGSIIHFQAVIVICMKIVHQQCMVFSLKLYAEKQTEDIDFKEVCTPRAKTLLSDIYGTLL